MLKSVAEAHKPLKASVVLVVWVIKTLTKSLIQCQLSVSCDAAEGYIEAQPPETFRRNRNEQGIKGIRTVGLNIFDALKNELASRKVFKFSHHHSRVGSPGNCRLWI